MCKEPIHGESVESLEDATREWQFLGRGTLNEAWRSGDIVRRARAPNSDAMVQVLIYLGARRAFAVPEVVAMSDRSIYLRYVEGKPVLRPWTDAVKTDSWIIQLGKWLSSYHTSIQGFQLRFGACFSWGPAVPEPGMIVCHGDLGPWNFLEKDGRLTGVIDWDLAHFSQSLDDLASTAIEMVPLRMPIEDTMGNDAPRSLLMNRLEKLLDAYGEIPAAELLSHAVDYIDRLIEDTKQSARNGIAPFDEFVKRGFLNEYSADRAYIKDYWIRGIPS